MRPGSVVARTLRSLRRSPGFVAIATVSMGVALGIATTMFAVMDAMTHPEPPFRDVGQLYDVSFRVGVTAPLPPSLIPDEVGKLEGVQRVAGWTWTGAMVMVGGRFMPIAVGRVAPGYFDLLDTRPRLGRLFSTTDHATGDAAIVNDRLWRRDFANRDTIGGATVQVEGRIYRVIGVLASGADRALRPEVFIAEQDAGRAWAGLVVRLVPGATEASFQTRLKALNDRLTAAYAGPKDRGIAARIHTLRPDPLQVRDFHRAMIGAAICILLIACANVAALMLARGLTRKRDYALRLALGASGSDIAREVVAEVTIVAVAGCVIGAVVTSWFAGLIRRAAPVELSWEGFAQPQWSWRVMALSMIAVVASIAVAGGFPAWQAARTDPAGPLKEGAGGTTGRAHTRFRWLVITELAVAMTLLMSTSLMLKSIRRLEAYDFGYPAERLLIAGVAAPWREDSTTVEEAERMRQQALAAVRQVDGVEDAVLGIMDNCSVMRNTLVTDLTTQGGPSLNMPPGTLRGGAGCSSVAPGFFRFVGIPMADGRDFEPGDLTGSGAVIIDQKTAKRLFPHDRAVGHSLKLGAFESDSPWYTIVGVVRDHRLDVDPYPEMGPDSSAIVYQVAAAPRVWARRGTVRGSKNIAIFVRTGRDVDGMMLRLSQALQAYTPTRGSAGVTRWQQRFLERIRIERFLSLVFTLVGLAALLLGAAGLYSVIAYVAGQRMREFAVRIAVGATRGKIVRLVLRDGFIMAIGGTGVGAGLGMWGAFLLWDRMWGVYPVDVEALVIAESVLMAVTMAACVVPALRASRSDPLEVIRAA